METPKKHNALGMLNTLKQALYDEAYLKALDIMTRAQKNTLNNGFYSENDD